MRWRRELLQPGECQARRLLVAAGVIGISIAFASGVLATNTDASPGQQRSSHATIIDRIAATVNDSVITESDIRWYIALDPEVGDGEPPEEVKLRALQQLIDQRLLDQEAEKLPTIEITPEEIGKYLADLIVRFPSESAFRWRIEAVGLDAESLRAIIKGRLAILRFIDFRFRSFVFVSEQEIQSYHEQHVVAVARERGEQPPALDQVRSLIGKIISDEKVKSEMISWLDEARQKAEINIYNPFRSLTK